MITKVVDHVTNTIGAAGRNWHTTAIGVCMIIWAIFDAWHRGWVISEEDRAAVVTGFGFILAKDGGHK